MKLPISRRLLACCDYVNPGDRIADVGCDHGYLSIHLLTQGIARSAIASDVAEGPLQSAIRNADKFGVRDKIAFYLSDGVRNVPRDFDTLICAGMGADTMISILEAAPWLRDPKYRLILQCQSKRPELRKYLYANGWRIPREILVKEGKFYYPITEVIYEPGHSLTPGGYHITPALIQSGSPLLPEFAQRVIRGLEATVAGLERTGGEKYKECKTVLEELKNTVL
ncbi:MAG: SAM-dependent methyltransferase [Ruminococcaceae bacterium]|nr:SAM-dependent methyltransferase [Oscillospiraceae bacterium]